MLKDANAVVGPVVMNLEILDCEMHLEITSLREYILQLLKYIKKIHHTENAKDLKSWQNSQV